MKILAQDWPAISVLMDEALELPPESRARWLEALPPQAGEYRDTLARLLANHEALQSLDFMRRPVPHAAAASTRSDASGTATPIVVGPYRLLRELGRGGMGSVWLAERSDGQLKRSVALKLPHPGYATTLFSERLIRERDILGALTHPNIARLYDAGTALDGQPYIALEYVAGESLLDFCDGRHLGLRERLVLFQQVLAAVQYAHAHLVIHRDLKPSNVLVGGDGQVRLLDFGIAKLTTDGVVKESVLTAVGGRALTPDYASPEQIVGSAVTTASDVYSLGVLLYVLLSGTRPYRLRRDSPAALEEAILGADVRGPSEAAITPEAAEARASTVRKLGRDLSGDLDTIVLKAMKKDPADRYATAEALAQDIDRYFHGFPIEARPDGRWYRLHKFLERNRIAAGATAAVFVALAAGLTLATWQARVAREEARTARAVQDFLADIFRANSADQPDPVKARATTARELLDVGAAKIGKALDDAPQARLRILKTLGQMYFDLGLNEQAIAMLRERERLSRGLYGPRSTAVAEALIDLAGSMGSSPQMGQRAPMLEEAVRILDRNDERRAPLRARALLALSHTVYETDIERAMTFVGEAVDLLRPGGASAEAADALLLQGSFARLRDDYGLARSALTEGLAMSALLPVRNPRREIEMHAYLGDVEFRTHFIPAAEEHLRLAHRLSVAKNGATHIDTLETEQRLGQFLFDTSRTREGLRLLAHAAEGALAQRGADDPQYVPQVQTYYGRSLVEVGRIEEGLDMLSHAVDARKKVAPGSRGVAHMLEYEVQGELQRGHLQAAEELLDAAAQIRRTTGMAAPGRADKNVRLRAQWLLARGRAGEAQGLLDGFTEPMPAGPDVLVDWIETTLLRSCVLSAIGRAEDAVSTARQVLDRIVANPAREYLRSDEALASLMLGKALRQAARPGEALSALTRSVDLLTELADADRSPVLADAQVALAACDLDLGRTKPARELATHARAVQALHPELAEDYTHALHDLETRLKHAT